MRKWGMKSSSAPTDFSGSHLVWTTFLRLFSIASVFYFVTRLSTFELPKVLLGFIVVVSIYFIYLARKALLSQNKMGGSLSQRGL